MLGQWRQFLDRTKKIGHVQNYIEWWEKQHDLGELRKIALLFLSIPLSSAEVERSFSILKDMVQPKRNRIGEDSIKLEMKLRYNKHTKI